MRPPERNRPRAGTDRLVRRGLSGLRNVEPPPGVWDRIAAELGPGPSARQRSRWRLNLPMATLAGVMCLAVMALAGLNAGLRYRSADVVEPVADHGLPPAELAIQPLGQRPVDQSLPMTAFAALAALEGWHLPQVAFNADSWPAPGIVTYGAGTSGIDARLQ